MSRARRPLRWTRDALTDRAFVIFILVALTAVYAVGLLVPQRQLVEPNVWEAWRRESPRLVRALEWSGAADAYRAPATYVLLGFFFLSLAAVLWERLPRLVRRTRLDAGVPLDPAVLAGRAGTASAAAADPREAVVRAGAALAAAGYALHQPEPGKLRAVRFRRSPLGFVLFHGAFGLLLAGALALDLTRFSGFAEVGSGEPFDVATASWSERPRLARVGRSRPDLAFTVLDVRPRSAGGHALALHVDLLLRGEAAPRTANINEPVTEGTTSILAVSAGAMPLFTCEAEGAEDGAWVKLVPNASGRTRFPLEPCGLDVLARPFAADAPAPGRGEGQGVMLSTAGGGIARLEEVARTGIEVAVRGPDGAVAQGVLRPGDSLATPDGRRVLHLADLRFYAKLQIVDEHGGGLLWAGFIVGVLGLVLRLVLFRREVVAVADVAGGRVLLATAADVVGWRPRALLERVARAAGGGAAEAGGERGGPLPPR